MLAIAVLRTEMATAMAMVRMARRRAGCGSPSVSSILPSAGFDHAGQLGRWRLGQQGAPPRVLLACDTSFAFSDQASLGDVTQNAPLDDPHKRVCPSCGGFVSFHVSVGIREE